MSLAHEALSIVIREHSGYLQSYVADQSRARLLCCLAIMTACEEDELVITDSFELLTEDTVAAGVRIGLQQLEDLRLAAFACIRGLVDLPHDNWDVLSVQFWHMAYGCEGVKTVSQ